MARLDRLGPAAKEVAQTGAAIGREFGYALLASTTDLPEPQLREASIGSRVAGLLFVRGIPPQSTYIFKHALVQDAAYGTLLRSRRQRLHARIVATLEDRFPEIVLAQPALLARHCAAAGLKEKAVDYWLTAGQQALARSAIDGSGRPVAEGFRGAGWSAGKPLAPAAGVGPSRRAQAGAGDTPSEPTSTSRGTPGPHPGVVAIDGGAWEARYGKIIMRGLAGDLVRRGWASTSSTGGSGAPPAGGWPESFEDVAGGRRRLARLDALARPHPGRRPRVGHRPAASPALWPPGATSSRRGRPAPAPVPLAAAIPRAAWST